jgi:hypothetical protein
MRSSASGLLTLCCARRESASTQTSRQPRKLGSAPWCRPDRRVHYRALCRTPHDRIPLGRCHRVHGLDGRTRATRRLRRRQERGKPTRQDARDGTHGIRVSAIAPGWTSHRMEGNDGVVDPRAIERGIARTPLGRVGELAELQHRRSFSPRRQPPSSPAPSSRSMGLYGCLALSGGSRSSRLNPHPVQANHQRSKNIRPSTS